MDTCTVIYWLIAMATITFSKQKEQLLSEGGYYTRVVIKPL